MPEMNGIEATRQIRAEHGRVKVIALSTHTDKRYVHAHARGWRFRLRAQDLGL